jgi:hypothetical protein
MVIRLIRGEGVIRHEGPITKKLDDRPKGVTIKAGEGNWNEESRVKKGLREGRSERETDLADRLKGELTNPGPDSWSEEAESVAKIEQRHHRSVRQKALVDLLKPVRIKQGRENLSEGDRSAVRKGLEGLRIGRQTVR